MEALKEKIKRLIKLLKKKKEIADEEKQVRADILGLMEKNKLGSVKVKDLGVEAKMIISERFEYDLRAIIETLELDFIVDKGIVKCDTRVCNRELKGHPDIDSLRVKAAERKTVRLVKM